MTTTTPRPTPPTTDRDHADPTTSTARSGRPARSAALGRTALRLEHTRELLTLVPHQLGFRPQGSVVLVALRPPGRTVGLVARLDVADVLAPDGAVLVAGAVAHLDADGAREVVVVVYGDEADPRDPARGLRPAPGADVVRAAEEARHAAALLGPVSVWYVTGDRYLGLDCRDRGCCPPGGRPLDDLRGGELAGRLLGRGTVAPSRDDVGVIRPAPPGPRRSAAAARSRCLDTLLRSDDAAAVLRWRQRSLDGWRGALSATRADPGAPVRAAVLGCVEAGLLDPVVRDAVVLTLVGGDAGLPDALVRAAPDGLGVARATAQGDPGEPGDPDDPDDPEDPDGLDGRDDVHGHDDDGAAEDDDPDAPRAPEDQHHPDDGRAAGASGGPGSEGARAVSRRVRDALDLMVDPVGGREPDDELVDAARAVLERVVAHGRRDRQAPALTLLALLAWWGGDAVRASVLVERALDQDPGHRLAELLGRALGYGLPPGWLRRRC